MAEDAVLERAEGMFDGGSPEPHQLRSGALVHAGQRVVVQVAAQHACCALVQRGFSEQAPQSAAEA